MARVVISYRQALGSFLIGVVVSSTSTAAEIDNNISSAAFTEEHQALKDCATDLGGDFRQRFERLDLNRDGSDVQGGDKVGHWSAGVMSVRAE